MNERMDEHDPLIGVCTLVEREREREGEKENRGGERGGQNENNLR